MRSIIKLYKEYNLPYFAFIFFTGLFLILFVEAIGFLNGIDNYFYDFLFRLRGERSYNSNIIIVTIDEKTLSKLGRWPISRAYYTDLLNIVNQAKAVGFDIILSEVSTEDTTLGQAIKRYGKVVLPAYIDSHFNISLPTKSLSAARIGHIHLEQDVDGIVRKVFHRISYKRTVLYSFSSILYALVTNDTSKDRVIQPDSQKTFNFDTIFQSDPMLINYYGPPGTFPTISLVDIIEGKWPPSFFKDKIVLVGLSSAGLENSFLSPFTTESTRMPGIEVHAHILNNLLDGKSIKLVDEWFRWPCVIAIALIGFTLFINGGGLRATELWVLGLLIIMTTVLVFFILFHLWLVPSSFYLSYTFGYIMAHIYKLEKMRLLLLKAKEDWEESFNTINDAITIHDKDCAIVQANKAAYETFGEPLLKLLKQRCLHLHQRERSSECNTFSEDNNRVKGEIIEEIFYQKMEKYFEIKSIAQIDNNLYFCGMVQIVRDITGKVEAEKEQQILQMQLAQAQKMEALGTLAGGIAHDFNNILTAIIGYTELTSLEIPTESNVQRNLQEVLKGGQRAKELVNEIMTFTRQSEREKKPVQVGSLIKEALKLIRSTLPTTIEIRTDICTNAMVMGNPVQIHQIIMNLCTNAYHAMQKNGGLLTVMLTNINNGSDFQNKELCLGPYVKISISDSGQGMSPDVLKRIFEPYFTTKEKGKGTGLGLAVVHGIVKEHGGTITVQSSLGKGTVFDIFLPRIEEKIKEKPEEGGPVPMGKERILLVDDEEVIVEMGQAILEKLGYEVTISTSSIEALETFRRKPNRFDLIITDMTMPYMSGETLAKEIMNIQPHIPIILCTGYNETITAEKAKSIGIKQFIMKPVKMKELALSIREALNEKNS